MTEQWEPNFHTVTVYFPPNSIDPNTKHNAAEQVAAALEQYLGQYVEVEPWPQNVYMPAACEEEIYSWDYYKPQQIDPYWIRCNRNEGHEGEHKDSETGASWK